MSAEFRESSIEIARYYLRVGCAAHKRNARAELERLGEQAPSPAPSLPDVAQAGEEG